MKEQIKVANNGLTPTGDANFTVSYNPRNLIRDYDIMDAITQKIVDIVINDIKGRVIEDIFKDQVYVDKIKSRILTLMNIEAMEALDRNPIKEHKDILQEIIDSGRCPECKQYIAHWRAPSDNMPPDYYDIYKEENKNPKSGHKNDCKYVTMSLEMLIESFKRNPVNGGF